MDFVHDSTEAKRLSVKAYLLTYSQTKLTKSQLYAFLTSGPDVERLIIGEEKHQDGNPHLHAYVVYAKQREVTYHAFDIGGEHPNIGTHRTGGNPQVSHWNCWQYCKKEDPEPLVKGDPPIQPPPPRKRKAEEEGSTPKRSKKDDLVKTCIEIAKDPERSSKEAFNLLQERMPAYAIERANAYRIEFQRIRSEALCYEAPARPLSAFVRAPKVLPNWRTLYIYGPTKFGKTEYARALLPGAEVIRHRDQLKDADMSKGLIFDDFDTSHWPITAVIALLDWDQKSGIDVKHGHVVVPAHTRKIFTHNKDFDTWLEEADEKHPRTSEQKAACRRRVHVFHIHAPLFDVSGQETPGQQPDDPMPVVSDGAVDAYFMSSDYNQPMVYDE